MLKSWYPELLIAMSISNFIQLFLFHFYVYATTSQDMQLNTHQNFHAWEKP